MVDKDLIRAKRRYKALKKRSAKALRSSRRAIKSVKRKKPMLLLWVFMVYMALGTGVNGQIMIDKNANIGYYNDSFLAMSVEPYYNYRGQWDNDPYTHTFTVTNNRAIPGNLCLAYDFSEPIESGEIIEKVYHYDNYTYSYVCDPPNYYNYSDNILYCWGDFPDSQNISSETKLVFSHRYDSYNLGANTIYWNEGYRTEEYIDRSAHVSHIELNDRHIYYSFNPLVYEGHETKSWVIRYEPSIHDMSHKWDLVLWGTQGDCDCIKQNSCLFISRFDPEWYNTSWLYNMNISITNITEYASGYPLPFYISLNTSYLINQGWLQADGDDLRLINPSGDEIPISNMTPIISDNSANTTYSFSADNGTYGLYFGNPNATVSTVSGLTTASGTAFSSDCNFTINNGNFSYWICRGIDVNNRNGLRKIVNNSDAGTNIVGSTWSSFQKQGGQTFNTQVFDMKVHINSTGLFKIETSKVVGDVYVSQNYTWRYGTPFVELTTTINKSASDDEYSNFAVDAFFSRLETNNMSYQDFDTFINISHNGKYGNEYAITHNPTTQNCFIFANPTYPASISQYTFYIDGAPTNQLNMFYGYLASEFTYYIGYIGRNQTKAIDIAEHLNWSFDYSFSSIGEQPPIPPENVTTLNVSLTCDLCSELPLKNYYCEGDNILVNLREVTSCHNGICTTFTQNSSFICSSGCQNATILGFGEPGCVENDFTIAIIFIILIFIVALIVWVVVK